MLHNGTTLGKIHSSRIIHGDFYCPIYVPGEIYYVVTGHGTRFFEHGWPSDKHKLYVQKTYGYPRWKFKNIGEIRDVVQHS